MSTARLPRPPAAEEIDYPDTDPKAMPENPVHFSALVALVVLVRTWFRGQPNVYVVGDVFWYYQRGNNRARSAPDLMVLKGVDPRTQRHSYKEWEHGGIRPCFILEILSKRTGANDTTTKKTLYETLGVREYFLFDPEGHELDQPLVGYRLVAGVYEEVAVAADGSLPSRELGLSLKAVGEDLILLDARTGRRLLEPPEMADLIAKLHEENARNAAAREAERRETEKERAAKKRALVAKKRALAAKKEAQRAAEEAQRVADEAQRVAAEAQRREAETRRAKEEGDRQREALLQELARLRAQLPPEAK